jgi:hypothetical protein
MQVKDRQLSAKVQWPVATQARAPSSLSLGHRPTLKIVVFENSCSTLMYRTQTAFALDKKRREGLALSPCRQIRELVQLLICIASLLIGSLITVITVNRTNTRCVFIPIVISDNTYICWCSVRVQVLVGVDVSLNWSVAVASSSKANYRQQYYA